MNKLLIGALLTFQVAFAVAQSTDQLTVERIWRSAEFAQRGVDGFTSLSDGEHFTKTVEESGQVLLKKYAFKNFKGEGETIVNLSSLEFQGKKLEVSDVQLSKSGKKLLILTGYASIYRRSFSAKYYVYDIASKECIQLHTSDKPQTLATFSPNEEKIAYISENNLYIKDLVTKNNVQITSDGKQNAIINGTTDWVYEEEFGITQGFNWSPDSKYIAYLKFDESAVKEFSMDMFGGLYPTQYQFKYPKAGEDNSKVTAHIYSLNKASSVKIELGQYEYLPRFQFAPNSNNLVLLTMNRHQSELSYHLIKDMENPADFVFYKETSDTYIDIDNNLLVLKDGKSILRTSEKDGYNHLYVLGFDGTQRAVTTGNWDVIELYGISDKDGVIYYASAEHGAIYKTLYSISLDGKKKKALSALTGTHNAEFSEGFNYFIRSSSSANRVTTYTLCDKTGKELQLLEGNEALQKKLDGMDLAKKEFIQVDGVEGKLNAWMMKPANFDPSKKYPVYFNVYCGPGSNTVDDVFEGANYMYHQLLTQKGYIVFSVDPRGTMFRGAKFKKSTYLQLGKLETEDLIAVAKNLQKESYVDPTRIGIQGWSYGGFMTASALTKGADVFKMGISVAPVTNWKYYDNIYTERFMRTPAENPSGYDDNSPINHVSKLKGKLLLIHGSADDNVHYQNSMDLISAFVKANKQFDLFIYPNKNHGIYGGNTRNHLFTMMLDYTLKNL